VLPNNALETDVAKGKSVTPFAYAKATPLSAALIGRTKNAVPNPDFVNSSNVHRITVGKPLYRHIDPQLC
jgi:hypothetical protein